MYNNDIKLTIFKHINDIISMISFCNVDKNTRKLCSTKSFWNYEFNKYNLTMTNISYTETQEWINEFMKIKYATQYMNEILLYNTINPNNIIYISCKNKEISIYTFLNIITQLGLTIMDCYPFYSMKNLWLKPLIKKKQMIVKYIELFKRPNIYSLIINITIPYITLCNEQSFQFKLTKLQMSNFIYLSYLNNLLNQFNK